MKSQRLRLSQGNCHLPLALAGGPQDHGDQQGPGPLIMVILSMYEIGPSTKPLLKRTFPFVTVYSE